MKTSNQHYGRYHNPMENGRTDYEAVHTHSERFIVDNLGLHNHDFYELFIHIRGGRSLCIDTQVYALEPNDLLIIPPYVMHGLVQEETIDYERAFLYITTEMLQTVSCGRLFFEDVLSKAARKGIHQYSLADKDTAELLSSLKYIQQNSHDLSVTAQMKDISSIISFLLILYNTINDLQAARKPLANDTIMQDVLTYIHNHFASALSIDMLARHFSISKSHLCHEFKKYTSHSIYDYILYRRVTHAKELITSGISFHDVAIGCGFSNYMSFYRTFRNLTGISPSEFRDRQHVALKK